MQQHDVLVTERSWLAQVLDLERVDYQDGLFVMPLPNDEQAETDAAYHDREAEWYDEYLVDERVAAAEEWIVQRILRLAKQGVVLDLGCGTGRIAEPLVTSGNRVIAVDHAQEMLRKLLTKVDSERLVPLCADVRQLPLPDASCDSVICSGVLHHIQDWPHVLSEVARVLRHGGRLIVREPNAGYALAFFTSLENVLTWFSKLIISKRKTTDDVWASRNNPYTPYERHFSIPELQGAFPSSLTVEFAVSTMLLGSLDLKKGFPARRAYYRMANRIDCWLFDRRKGLRSGALLFVVARKRDS